MFGAELLLSHISEAIDMHIKLCYVMFLFGLCWFMGNHFLYRKKQGYLLSENLQAAGIWTLLMQAVMALIPAIEFILWIISNYQWL